MFTEGGISVYKEDIRRTNPIIMYIHICYHAIKCGEKPNRYCLLSHLYVHVFTFFHYHVIREIKRCLSWTLNCNKWNNYLFRISSILGLVRSKWKLILINVNKIKIQLLNLFQIMVSRDCLNKCVTSLMSRDTNTVVYEKLNGSLTSLTSVTSMRSIILKINDEWNASNYLAYLYWISRVV